MISLDDAIAGIANNFGGGTLRQNDLILRLHMSPFKFTEDATQIITTEKLDGVALALMSEKELDQCGFKGGHFIKLRKLRKALRGKLLSLIVPDLPDQFEHKSAEEVALWSKSDSILNFDEEEASIFTREQYDGYALLGFESIDDTCRCGGWKRASVVKLWYRLKGPVLIEDDTKDNIHDLELPKNKKRKRSSSSNSSSPNAKKARLMENTINEEIQQVIAENRELRKMNKELRTKLEQLQIYREENDFAQAIRALNNEIATPKLDSYVQRNLPWTPRKSYSEDIVAKIFHQIQPILSGKQDMDVCQVPLFTITGASGLGKTRLGVELLGLLEQHANKQQEKELAALFGTSSRLIFLNFANGDLIGVKKGLTKKELYGQLAFRILYPHAPFEDHEFKNIAIPQSTFIQLINKLRKDPKQKFFLHIQVDEFQKGFTNEDFKTIASGGKNVLFCTYLSMLLKIAKALQTFNIFTMISCTGVLNTEYRGLFPATDYNIVNLPLLLLPEKAALDLVEQAVGREKSAIPFVRALTKAMGGLPKALNALVAQLKRQSGTEIASSINQIWSKTCEELAKSYRFPNNLELLGRLTSVALLDKELVADQKIGDHTIIELEEEGYIFIREKTLEKKCKISIPYVLLSLWKGSYNSFNFGNVFSRKQFPPLLDSSDFEKFALYFQAWKYLEEQKLGNELNMKALHHEQHCKNGFYFGPTFSFLVGMA